MQVVRRNNETYHPSDKLEQHHGFSAWIPFHPLLREGKAEPYGMQVKLLEINTTGIGCVDQFFDFPRRVTIRPSKLAPHAVREARHPIRMVVVALFNPITQHWLDKPSDAFGGSGSGLG